MWLVGYTKWDIFSFILFQKSFMFECSIDRKNIKIIIFYCEDVETVNKN